MNTQVEALANTSNAGITTKDIMYLILVMIISAALLFQFYKRKKTLNRRRKKQYFEKLRRYILLENLIATILLLSFVAFNDQNDMFTCSTEAELLFTRLFLITPFGMMLYILTAIKLTLEKQLTHLLYFSLLTPFIAWLFIIELITSNISG